MVWKATEWQSATGYWHCACTDDLTHNSAAWWIPARILEISPAEYIQYMIDSFKPDLIYANKEKCFICFSWLKQEEMRKWKNFINRKAREKNFQI